MALYRRHKLICFNEAFGRLHMIIGVLCLLLVFYLLVGLSNLTNNSRSKQVHDVASPDVESTIRHVHDCNCIVTIAGSVSNSTQVVASKWKGDSKQSISDLHTATLNETDIKQQSKTLHLAQSAADLHTHNDIHAEITKITATEHKLDASVQDTKPTVKAVEAQIISEHKYDLSTITIKPNFSSLINASQSIPTLTAPYLLENPTLCSSVKNLSIAIIVHTAPDHVERRFSIRNTWANGTYYQHLGNVRVIFLLGKTMDGAIQHTIEQEFKSYGDILQGDFKDAYHNLTLKGVMAYKWLTERCRNANLILKVDDDISVDMFKLFAERFPIYKLKTNTIICNHIIAHTMSIIRKNDSKWYVEDKHFRGLGGYPTDYCSGFFVVFTNDIIPALYISSKVTPFFWVDDVYLYGLVPGNIPWIKYVGLTGDWHQLGGQAALRCYRNETLTCPFIAVGAGAIGEMEDIWPQMVKQYALSVK